MKDLSPRLWLFALVALILTAGLGYTVEQHEFGALMAWYIPLFGLYLWSLRRTFSEKEVLFLLSVAIALRLVLIGALPGLSDDLYRFIWDGRLMAQGYNPFDHLPIWYLEQGVQVPGINQTLYDQLNSPGYYTIYPPVAQFTFALASWLFPNSILGPAIVMRLFLILCEIGALYFIWRLLKHFNMPLQRSLIYALNPLIIIEITGNLHYEGAMVFFLLLAFWLLVRSRWVLSALAMALSIASKLLTLMFLPFLIRRLKLKRSFWYFLLLAAILIALFIPILSTQLIDNFGNSLDLYFRKFEFNASIYYLARWIGYQKVGYNMIADIGPLLASFTLSSILLLTLLEERPDWQKLPERMLFAITIYLLLTTTAHPWYTSLPIALCLFTSFRYPVLWSGLIMLTYINYSYAEYRENLWVVALEYTAVIGYLLWEVRKTFLPKGIKGVLKNFWRR